MQITGLGQSKNWLTHGWAIYRSKSGPARPINKPSSPQAYRLIALLSVLEKRLECLIACRMTWIAIKHRILHPQYFEALPLHSATELTMTLIHDVGKAWAWGLKASMLTLDVQDAFDAVLSEFLIEQLQKQGWPINVIHWMTSFFQDWTASLYLGTHISKTFDISADLSQDSPISPILFMLFIKPIFKQGLKHTHHGCLGYADDICQLVASHSLEKNCTTLQHCTEELRQWDAREGLIFWLQQNWAAALHMWSQTL